MSQRVAVLGTGLIGTSIALAARQGFGALVVGYDPDSSALEGAQRRGALQPAGSLEEAAGDADLVFVCPPVSQIPHVAAAALRAGSGPVTDVGSAKMEVLRRLDGLLAGDEGLGSRFVGGHPMTGSERSGPEAASSTLLDGAIWVLTPTKETDGHAVRSIEEAVNAMGGQPIRLDPERHDRMVALTSHLPQLASSALMRTATEEAVAEPELLMLSAGGFRDLTRLAASNPALWVDILEANREALGSALELFARRLEELAALVANGDTAALTEALEAAKRSRLELAAKPTAKLGVAIFGVPIPDRPGALAEITALLSAQRVNIEDLEIVHSAEGARGTVHLTVAVESADATAKALEERGYRVALIA
ncbi:MAG: prephenate dehydrogenase/arogenate dehydrogenase family protein [Actinomycetota bacterium]